MPRTKNRIGEVYGDLTVKHFGKKLPSRHSTWVCECMCGTEIEVAYPSLKNGRTKSCGCARQRTAHCMSESSSKATQQEIATYKSWKGMKYRCSTANKNYGGRGIQVCERWQSFTNFLEDMGLCPEGYSIERVDVNGNYEPSNCMWIPFELQGRNKRDTVRVMYKGEEVALIDICEQLGLNYRTVYSRIHILGYTVEEALEDRDNRKRID